MSGVRMRLRAWCMIGGLLLTGIVQAEVLQTRKVTDGVYALLGSTGPRTYDNYGLNTNLGFVVTADGVLLIDAGATVQSGPLIARQIARVTDQPVRWVVNTGSQDHRWLGNGYFKRHGARIIALAATVHTQQANGAAQLAALRRVLKGRLDGTTPVVSDRPQAGDRARLELGGVMVELRRFGDTHFPGDAVVWLPRQKVLFSGDMIYVDRLLGIMPESRTVAWREAFHRMALTLAPTYIVPGHGSVCDMAKAKAQTGAYLDWLVASVGPAVENWEPLEATVTRLDAQAPKAFRALEHFDTLDRANINRTFVQMQSQ